MQGYLHAQSVLITHTYLCTPGYCLKAKRMKVIFIWEILKKHAVML